MRPIQQIDLSAIQSIISRYDLQAALVDSFLQDWFGRADLPGHAPRVRDHTIMDSIARIVAGCVHRRLNRLHQRLEMSRHVSAFDRGRNRAALLVAQHHDQLCFEMLHRVLDAAQDIIVHQVPRHPDDEQISQALIEKQLGGNSRVGASENHGKRMLTRF